MSTIFSLAHSLWLGIYAKGVQTEEQAKILRFLRCNEMEGHLISRPPGGADDAPRAAWIKVRWVVDRSDRARTLRSARFSTGSPDPTNVDGLLAFVLVLLYSAVKL